MESKLTVSSSPHLHGGASTRLIMLDVIIALVPALIASVWLFGWQAAAVIAVSVGSCVASEYLSRVVLKRPQTVGDLSCVVTGLLLAFNLPATMPLWEVALGGVAAIVVAKQMFGGIGHNFVNPALAGRLVLMASFPSDINNWVSPLSCWFGGDTISAATPLALMSTPEELQNAYTLPQLLFGVRGGCLGETCVLALLLGFVYLVVRRVINPLVPVVFVGTVFVLTWLISGDVTFATYQILSGGLMLGAVFMATDYSTTPITGTGKLIFAFGCGLITVLIRTQGALPEGVSFAIILMNIATPLIERFTRPRPFGTPRKKEVSAK